MKKTLLALTTIISFCSIAQEFQKCATHSAIEYQESINPGFKQQIEEEFQRAKQWSLDHADRTDEILKIPVVIHIVYNTPEENLPDSVILEQILSLNEDYGRNNGDTINMRSDFQTIVGDTRIRFELALQDPAGNPTNGITRTPTNVENFSDIFGLFTGDMSAFEKVKSTTDGGIDPWDQSRYLNIWVCDMSINGANALLGYATPPDGLSHWPAGSTDGLSDGVVIQYQAFGRNNPNPLEVQDQSGGGGTVTVETRGRTTTHEVGHYLGLRHIWGDGDCNEQDGVDDTPNATAQSDFDCDDTKNTCVDAITTLGDLPDMIENYMDYSAETCQNSFTKGQKGIMYGVLENQRYDLVHDNVASIVNYTNTTLKLYPNPSAGVFNIETEIVDYTISIVSLDGKIIETLKNSSSIDLSSQEKGIYFMNLISNHQIISTQKIILK